MSGPANNQDLNRLLIDLGRSLLQYVGECWPWTSSTSSAQTKLEGLVEQQRAGVGKLFELLNHRGYTVDFGAYPTEYTDLHYCALSFLLKELIEEASESSQEIASIRATCAGDPEAAALLDELAADERKLLGELKALAGSTASGAAA